MSIYHEAYQGEHKLTEEEIEVLKEHVRQCGAPFLNCDACLKLYTDKGYPWYSKFIAEVAEEYGPTESEQHL